MSKAFRLFTSAPIVKRHDALTLQTADGICVCIRGFINKQRTIENGFSSEVFTHFFIGFPPYWEKYAKECLGETIMADVGLEVVPNSSNAARDSGPSLISTPCNHAVNLPTMVEERTNLDSSQQKGEASTIKVQDEQNLNRKTLSCLTSKLNHVKESSLEKETRKKLDFEEVASSVSRERKGNKSIISPESLNFKRSRSGRVLLPRMEFWRNQIPVYDQDRRITGIKEEVDDVNSSGSGSYYMDAANYCGLFLLLSLGSRSNPKYQKR
ncbi:kinetochore-associated protein KNL-2 homolog isoform X3 [Gossypium hirsutum]|uniref:Kinetochore-associated protein KNL-2 homolog isoform X3 n=1 Tax=Gossypium hirsutum TaxID=3635 RepID=A0ABM3ARE6_GOSHI|nr:kinetochore-associated protein KNL-2 homolog isoform X3 [Gossypium hirsutum]